MRLLILCQYTFYLENSIVIKIFQKHLPNIKIKEIINKRNNFTIIYWILNLIKFLRADFIILGPFMPHYASKFLKIIKLIRKNKPIIIYHTKEVPISIHQYRPWEESDYFITVSSYSLDNHFYLPPWWEFFSFGEDYDTGRKNHKLGKFVNFEDVNQRKVPFEKWYEKENKAVLISTHLSHPKDYFYKKLSKIIKCEGYGRAFDKSIKGYYSSGFTKIDKLANARYDLSLFNAVFPGYVDERIFDGYACGCIPITNNIPEFMDFINTESIIFLHNKDEDEIKNILSNKDKLKEIYDAPLIKNRPNLNELNEFIKKIINQKNNLKIL